MTAAAPGLYGQVLISHGVRSGGGLIKGVIPADEKTVGDLLQKIDEGSAAALEPVAGSTETQAIPPIVIGKDMADEIGVKVGDAVVVTSPQGQLTPLGLVPKYQTVHGGGDLQVRVLSVRLQLCVHAAARCAAAILRAGLDLGDQLQGRRSL